MVHCLPSAVQIFLTLMLLSSILTLFFWYTMPELKGKHHYTGEKRVYSLATETILIFWAFLILFSVMVPMAMFVLAEFIYLGNSIFINWDVQMYYEPRDRPAKARNTSLADQLGQVEYIFSDKTGTLTENIMTFKKCCIDGIIYGGLTLGRGGRGTPNGPGELSLKQRLSPGPDEEEIPRKENPYIWNKFADGKLLFRNLKLMGAVLDRKDRMVQEFWRLLAICHTVMAQEKDNKLVYQAASPDEEALVTAARNFGYVFLARTQDSITVVELGEERVYQVLAIMDFNSIRKRMSVLVRDPEGSIYLYTKGADIVIFDLLCKKALTEWKTEEALASFAQETLRTLCLAYKKVDEDAYKVWHQRHQEASILLQNRAHALHQLYEEMEQNLQLLGATAIEDRLQDGVPETIQCLKQGNIKVWVLTGDKQETAVNIGFACRLLSEDMLILEEKEIVRILEAYGESNNNLLGDKDSLKNLFLPQVKTAMVINGEFLDQLLLSLHKEPRALVQNVSTDLESWQGAEEQTPDFPKARRVSPLWQSLRIQLRSAKGKGAGSGETPDVQREQAFVELASRCQAVICCRVTPKQKALIVALVKKYRDVVTLAIGDGANDVNMIKTADVGVGLAGQEGMQAVHSSDYVLAQFCFLRRLLLVHGRWSYMRICKFLRYFIYKTVASMMVQIWFAFYNGFTAQPLYEGWFLALYNLLYTTLPVLYIGLFEQDLSAKQSLELPELYVHGQQDRLFNYWVFFQAVAHGMATSLVNFFVTLWVSRDTAGPLSFSDYQSFAEVVALSCLLSITVEEKAEAEAEIPSQEIITVDTQPYLHRGSRSRRSSYAFSHREGYADLITQGTILRRSPAINSDILADHTFLPDEELVLNITKSPWYRRRMSFLVRTLRLQEKVSSEEVPSTSTASSSLTMEGKTSGTKSTTPSTNVPSTSSLEKLSAKQVPPYSPEGLPPTTERPPSPRESQPLPSYQSSLENRPASLEEKKTFWKMSLLSWKSWQKESHSFEAGTAPPPNETQTACAAAETLPPSRVGSPTCEQATEVEPSATQGPPAPGGQPSDTPPGTAAPPPPPREGQ
ncbi:Putative phospholipid-transporting ATPase IK [Pteropus alecto]|uniref:Phospholipid-transporting ATPase n=1 Tax=Pteropus alecto TaxID=9402 RepID=L5L6Q4_PTEAL|nr:Putative phospholipid-transporting ATPase IK [Pteropus alecto]